MRTLPIKIWHEFQLAVATLSDEAPLRQVLEVILFWIRSNYKHLAGEPFSIYGFDSFAKVDEREIPVEYSSFKVSDLINFKSVILKRQARDVEAIARFLRDTVEELATVEIDEQCPKCKSEGVRVFIGKHNGLLACQCNVCGYSHYSDGSRVESGGLEFASEMQLREFGLI
ncbi:MULTISPECIES: hypothetical protein [Pseudomonas syringae group]|uniref:Uncharacterized protein n=2 Tax=Pseudomonas syringae group TaxID=136849 RepID=A0A0P9Q9G3_PSESX|nr:MULTISPECIES: hypothetical protein [Pseudomonas syringae group]KPW94386.1 Uncharacterized protein ALO79_04399 [Pseudomonas syringae pv. castaneae]KWS89235.1 hypothetical protein AL048_09715 [Pseudomonas syringae pv. castaneae]KWS97987.1 hypothetical protein AL049_12780 [Pseudomonas syringae pv. cerasicola]PHN79069.1 hypothetical protein AO272_06500 [Pseudomonas syringae pv. cerasicola]PHN80279.1 hypothetical protein AO252_10625 [Pseudomonas syringae pv. cerasicola]